MKIVTALLIAVVSLGVVGIAQADSKPFVSISATSNSLEFGKPTFADPVSAPGSVLFPNIHCLSAAALTLKVESNCFHGPIIASITALERPRGNSIPPERISVKSPTTNGYVTMEKPVAISNPETGSHDIELDFQLEVLPHDRAGRYIGTITFTIMPPPP